MSGYGSVEGRWWTRAWWLPAWAGAGVLARSALGAVGAGPLRFYDEHDYHALARALASGEGFVRNGAPTAFRPPAGPLAVASVYAVAGARPWLFATVQSIALASVPFAIARLASVGLREEGSRLTRPAALDPRATAAAAGALAAAHPGLAYAATTLYPTVLTAVALAWGVALVAEAVEGAAPRRMARALGGGLSLAIAGLATSYFAPVAVAAALVAALRRRFGVAALVAVAGVLPTAAWMARNHRALGAPTLTTNGGYNLALGAQDAATPRSGNWIEPALPPGHHLPDGELARDEAYRAVARDWIRAHPLRFGALAIGRAAAVLDSVGRPRTAGAHDGLGARVVGWSLLPVTVLGLVGLWLRRRSVAARLAAIPLALVVVSASLTIVKPRFRFPCDPLLAPFAVEAAAVGFVRARARLRGRSKPRAATEPLQSDHVA